MTTSQKKTPEVTSPGFSHLCQLDTYNLLATAIIAYAVVKIKYATFYKKVIRKVVSFYALAKYARAHRSDWHRILCDCGSVFMREYLQSRKWSVEQNYSDIIDPETGEVLQ